MLDYVGGNPALLEKTGAEVRADIIAGAEKALFGPDARSVIFEGIRDVSDDLLPEERDRRIFLTRIAHLETSGTADFDEPLGLTIGVHTTHLSIQRVTEMTEEAIQELEFARGDGAVLTLSDQSVSLFHLFFDYIPIGEHRSNESSWFLGHDAFSEKPSISNFEGFLAIADVLKHGHPSDSPIKTALPEEQEFVEATDPVVIERCIPYFYGLYKRVVEAPNLASRIEATRRRDLEAVEAY
ncbi:MAG TPA: hypothetical protein VFX86_03200 [Candidatus Saccharimonadales bacterium]|nr:hypothetical protein [Candidatus Saccharimonadales bacterium]